MFPVTMSVHKGVQVMDLGVSPEPLVVSSLQEGLAPQGEVLCCLHSQGSPGC